MTMMMIRMVIIIIIMVVNIDIVRVKVCEKDGRDTDDALGTD